MFQPVIFFCLYDSKGGEVHIEILLRLPFRKVWWQAICWN